MNVYARVARTLENLRDESEMAYEEVAELETRADLDPNDRRTLKSLMARLTTRSDQLTGDYVRYLETFEQRVIHGTGTKRRRWK
jgi:hypothetical protein